MVVKRKLGELVVRGGFCCSGVLLPSTIHACAIPNGYGSHRIDILSIGFVLSGSVCKFPQGEVPRKLKAAIACFHDFLGQSLDERLPARGAIRLATNSMACKTQANWRAVFSQVLMAIAVAKTDSLL